MTVVFVEATALAPYATFQPSHAQSPRPMIQVLSSLESHGIASVNMVTAYRYGQGSRDRSVPQNIRLGPNES